MKILLLTLLTTFAFSQGDPGSRQGWATFGQNSQRQFQGTAAVNVAHAAASSYKIGSYAEKIADCAGFAPSPLVTADGNWYILVPQQQSSWCDYTLVLFSPSNNTVLATYESSTSQFPPFIDRAGTVYVASESYLVALSPDLKEQWRLRLTKSIIDQVATADFVLSNDDSTAYFYVDDTTTHIGQVDLVNKKLGWLTEVGSSLALPSQLQITLSPAGDRVLVVWQNTTGSAYFNTLYALDAASGAIVWTDVASAVLTSSNAVGGCGDGSDGGAVYWYNGLEGVVSLNASDGSTLWSNEGASFVQQFSLSCEGAGLLVGASGTGSMLVLNATTGATVGDYVWPDGIVFPTVLGLDANNTLFFTAVSGADGLQYVYGAAAVTGETLLKLPIGTVGTGLAQIAAFSPLGGLLVRTSAAVGSAAVYSYVQ
eukprot:TRINITY_DN10634_c0_g1_i2.p1 TRINITY_DN10634_c0_g1~~TRINITY_DN10634_c0_g1_i2.p1  ORF type:complete len:426 (+),score=194.13 TRINITY_DN10634_c0_g1_i2:1633-2910(+)